MTAPARTAPARTTLARAALALAAIGALTWTLGTLGGDRGPRCALDGVGLEGPFRVRVESPGGTAREFCSVRCAEGWIGRTESIVSRVVVRDEAGGGDVDAADAWFARSTVAASRASGERIHAFARREDAEAHVASFGGRVLEGDERPLAPRARGGDVRDGRDGPAGGGRR